MTDLEPILQLWRELEAARMDYVLATVVEVEGSSYRKPGARMLLAADGRRAGTVSGGCLEAEVSRRSWWLTEAGPTVEAYSTADDDGDRPYGSGCGGVVHLLLERRKTAHSLLLALATAFHAREPLAVATVMEGARMAQRSIAGIARELNRDDAMAMRELAADAFARRDSADAWIELDGDRTRVWTEYCAARPGLWIFSAGDDARPLARMARELGWFVAVSDGRSHLATRERFPEADEVRVLPIAELPRAAPAHFDPRSTDAAVVMTHSFEQDSHVLASLFALKTPPAYVGVLGPQRRTRELLAEAATLLRLPATEDRLEAWMAQLYAPTGLDLGAETPAAVAVSILAEMQKVLSAATGRPLRQVRAHSPAVAPR